MKLTPSFRLVLCAAVGACLLAGSSSAQQAAAGPRIVKIDRIDGKKMQTPEYQVQRVTLPSTKTRTWFQIGTDFQTAPDWIDEMDVTYYALAKTSNPPAGQSPYTLFRGQLTYVNVEKGSHESVMYLHPSTLARYGDVEQVAVLIYVKGQLAALESRPSSQERWWERLTPQEGYLLNRLETPFAMLNFDNYEAMKASGGRR